MQQIRDFMNVKIDENPSSLVLLCGDMNVDSTDDRLLLECKKGMGELSPYQQKVFDQAIREYDTMLMILSNLGTEEI